MSRSRKNPAAEAAPGASSTGPEAEASEEKPVASEDTPDIEGSGSGKKDPGLDEPSTGSFGPPPEPDSASPEVDEVAEATREMVDEVAHSDEWASEVPETGADVDPVQAELAQTKDRWLRAMAELQNFRKRSRRELESALNLANAKVLRELLEVVDNFERALAAEDVGDNRPDDSFLAGIRLIYDQLMEVLRQNGVSRIEAEGASFDPNLHEAVLQVESEEVESHHVVQVVQQGYLLRETVLRPARVIVAT